MKESLACLLEKLPSSPGVYEMKNSDGETLYVGKAKHLNSRVRSYFQHSKDHSPRIKKLVEKIDHIEWTETRTEGEALLLENNLIKEKYPKFNILLRDDKTYAYIKITNEDFPRIQLVRKVLKDGAKYFGPKTSTSAVRKTIDLLQKLFKFRSTPIAIIEESDGSIRVEAGNQRYPCLHYHLKKCDAPCLGNISTQEYQKKVIQAVQVLKGNTKDLVNTLQQEMQDLAKNQEYERAGKVRDTIFALQKISEKQIISAPTDFSADIIGVYSNFGHVFFHVFSVRMGKIINSETFPIAIKNENSLTPLPFESQKESFSAFLKGHVSRVSDIPRSILMDASFLEDDALLWEEFFTAQWGQKTSVLCPQKGGKYDMLCLAHHNAESYAKRHSSSFLKNNISEEESLTNLQKKLHMDSFPKRMECYDISHFSGEKTVASMVVFEDGKPKNKDYRSFGIKTLAHGEIDDFKSLAEALSRRLKHLPLPPKTTWSIKKITRKKDWNTVSQTFLPFLGKSVSSQEYCSLRDESVKITAYGLFVEEEIKMGNKPGKKNEVLDPEWIVWSKGEKKKENVLKNTEETATLFVDSRESNDSNNPPLPKISFFLLSLFESLKKKKYKVYASSPQVQDFLTSQGFELFESASSPHIFWKSWTSLKKNSFAQKPDIVVIDGGKGQLSSTWEVLKKSSFRDSITLCALAKREEEVFFINQKNGGVLEKSEIQKNSPEGHLLQRIRDEAHRFALTKNRIGREKNAQKSVLDEIKGVGAKTKKILKKQFGGVAGIQSASDEDLLKVVSKTVLKTLREKI